MGPSRLLWPPRWRRPAAPSVLVSVMHSDELAFHAHDDDVWHAPLPSDAHAPSRRRRAAALSAHVAVAATYSHAASFWHGPLPSDAHADGARGAVGAGVGAYVGAGLGAADGSCASSHSRARFFSTFVCVRFVELS